MGTDLAHYIRQYIGAKKNRAWRDAAEYLANDEF